MNKLNILHIYHLQNKLINNQTLICMYDYVINKRKNSSNYFEYLTFNLFI